MTPTPSPSPTPTPTSKRKKTPTPTPTPTSRSRSGAGAESDSESDCRIFGQSYLCFSHICSRSIPRPSLFSLQNQPKSSIPLCRFWNYKHKRRISRIPLRAIRRESPYEVLGVSHSATLDEIKRVYRKLALKYHPDVNKEADAQDKFVRIEHAYNTLLNSQTQNEEVFYRLGNFVRDVVQITLGDFFRDLQREFHLQREFQNWEASVASQGKPKSLWEELAEIGEEFVEFLEKELNITDQDAESYNSNGPQTGSSFRTTGTDRTGSGSENKAGKGSSIEENIDDIEAVLAQLKKELGL